ncbi:hypothetical protein CAC42_7489 [Sphaceloma murrayae]|uniref:Glycosyl transferase CAP10 domain-containing protein n=1 Tax=Sphaceloma murrayae TaxID=2082308 RepID=A0A2K1QX62_9PEZI|nr:hypothetical protein CAC42_7489 [Sphaceloma murrayae]
MSIRTFKRMLSKERILWICLLFLGVTYLRQAEVLEPRQTNLRKRGEPGPQRQIPITSRADHPVKVFAQNARADFFKMIDRQSRTYTEAVAEYRRRYSRDPPPGFRKWYEYAKKHNSVIIDDYDMINENMAPYWNMTPRQVRALLDRGSRGPALFNVSVNSGIMAMSGDHYIGKEFISTLSDIAKDLPDFQILLNPMDEPRVVPVEDADLSSVSWLDHARRSSWNVATAPCKSEPSDDQDTAADTLSSASPAIETFGLPFVTDAKGSKDICKHPEYRSAHGLFISPCSFSYTNQPVPIFSASAPATFGDILYPSQWYYRFQDRDRDRNDVPWEFKWAGLYWAGSTTGGCSTEATADELAENGQRQRFVALANGMSKKPATFLADVNGRIQTYQSSDVFSQLYDAKFTSINQCDGPNCERATRLFGASKHEEEKLTYQARFLMDMDGNAFSGRFYRFLASNSLPFKMTILREWHDERLVPWYHYVPISLSMDELPETLRYLALTKEGDTVARGIAQAGKEWHDKILRREDATIYIYRLLLEFARVQSETRDGTVGGL